MSNFSEIKGVIDGVSDAFASFKKTHDERHAQLLDRVEIIEAKGLTHKPPAALSAEQPVRYLKTQGGAELPYLMREQKFADLYRSAAKGEDFDLGEYCRAALMGAREGKVASGNMLVPVGVGSIIIDLLRAQNTIVRAGAGTIRIEGPTNLARITGDPTIYVHTEAAADISESDITASAVVLNPKTLAALIPLTTELVMDSPNLNNVLQTAIANAFALKLDQLAIAAIIADAAVPKSAAAHDPALWTGTNSAIAAALAVNQDLPRAHISTPANFAARSVILASTAGSWLGKPPYLGSMLELFSSNMTADQALFGDFAAGVAMAIRSDLTVEIVRHGKPTSGSHLLVAHLRAAPVILQPARLFWQKKVP